ncbi:YdcH family protein [Pseudoalteromonas sp. GB56]
MLGEKHSLLNDFPQYNDLIHSLAKKDLHFKKTMQRYDEMDKEIRNLELRNSPIDDIDMHEKKHQRAVLKDELYEFLKANA